MKWYLQVEALINSRNAYLAHFGRVFGLAGLTFAIPLLQWLANKLIEPSGYGTLLGNLVIISVLGYWSVQNKLFDYHPLTPVGKLILYLLGFTVLVLLILDVYYQPISGITGQPRAPYKVIDVVVLGSIAEELVFRGAMWSLFQGLSKGSHGSVTALTGTSILFGVGHLGYWMQSFWPLLPEAYIHAISMILAGLFFGIFRLKTRSVTVPIFMHVLANAIILLFQPKI